MTNSKTNYMTQQGHADLAKELNALLHDERPKIVEIVSWAAGNGDRSENGDYIYNKKKLREIDRRIRYLSKKLDDAVVVDPQQQQDQTRVFFGAEVTYVKEDDTEVTVRLVGVDEADFDQGKINWQSPVGRALLKAQAGDVVELHAGGKTEELEIIAVSYPVG